MSHVQGTPEDRGVYEQARMAADGIAAMATGIRPQIAIILGSGLGALADAIEGSITIPFTEIPYFLPATVAGHDGQLVLGTFAGASVAVLRGRLHLYEGYSPQQVTFPLRALRLLGIETCILTNAAGGLDPSLTAGALVLIRDHIGLPILVGFNPLFGPNDERFGPRFPAMTDAYDPALRQIATVVASEHDIKLVEGVYAMVGGPSFETQAELRMLRLLGADVVGMSTVPEAIVSRQMGMRVLAISTVTNQTLADAQIPEIPDHEDVLRVAAEATRRLTTLLRAIVAQMA